MTFPHDPRWSDASQSHYPPDPHTFALAHAMGGLEARVDRQTEISLATLKEVQRLPERIGAEIAQAMAATPCRQHGKDGPVPHNEDRPTLLQWAEFLRALWPLVLIVAVVFGKMTWPDAIPLIREAVGVSP